MIIAGFLLFRTLRRIPGRRFTISNAASSVETDILPGIPLPPGTLGLPFIGETLETSRMRALSTLRGMALPRSVATAVHHNKESTQ